MIELELPAGVFLCPDCRAPWSDARRCAGCGFELVVAGGVPMLVRDRAAIETTIAEAKAAGRADWYEGLQEEEMVAGAYRHHVKKRRVLLDRVLAQRVAAKDRMVGLDLGCGDGSHLAWLGGYVKELYGSDYNLLRLQRAARTGAARCVFMADILNYPMRDDLFDLILFNHVLEHIEDDATALAETFRVLKPGGTLVLGVPNEGAWFWRLAYRLQPAVRRASDHVHFYTADELSSKCTAAGFGVAQVEHIGWGVPHWSLDEKLRQFKLVDDALEWIGRRAFHEQATSLYLVLTKGR